MRIKDRVGKHKSTIRKENTLLPIPQHFIEKNHCISQLRFQIIEEVTLPRRGGNRIQMLHQCEAYWIHRKHLPPRV